MPVKTSNSFHEKPEGFSPERRNVFKKLRRLLKQIPKGPATPSRASGTREKIVRSMSRNRAVVGAELCGRWSRIVRSFQANRAVDFFCIDQSMRRYRAVDFSPSCKPFRTGFCPPPSSRRKTSPEEYKKRGCILQDTSSSFFYCKCDASNQASAGASAASSAGASSAFAAASASALAAASAAFFSATF